MVLKIALLFIIFIVGGLVVAWQLNLLPFIEDNDEKENKTKTCADINGDGGNEVFNCVEEPRILNNEPENIECEGDEWKNIQAQFLAGLHLTDAIETSAWPDARKQLADWLSIELID